MPSLSRPKVYLAGPDVFYPDAVDRLQRHLELCAQLGLDALVPVDNDNITGTPREQALGIYQGNLEKMKAADAIIANITPFRGPHMDPGTAFEIGFFVAHEKPVVCYSSNPVALADRVRSWDHQSSCAPSPRDRDGALIEDFGLAENLMIEGAVALRSLGHGVDASLVLTCFEGFDSAARAMAQSLLRPQ